MPRSLLCIHTSPPAIAPVNNYFLAASPSLRITNLLDDGLLRSFRDGEYAPAETQLVELVALGRRAYDADAVLITCSSVPSSTVRKIGQGSPIPVLRIDEPMAEAAIRGGRRIGVLYTFPPTEKSTMALLESAAAQAGAAPEFEARLVPGAYDALLAGRKEEHDALVLAAAEDLACNADILVLAQVSMAHLSAPIEERTGKRALSSLAASFAALDRRVGLR